jgi:hypothetical protein
MGLTYHEVRELLSLAEIGAPLDAVLTVGRQNLYLHDRDVSRLARRFRLDGRTCDAARPFGRYADDFLRAALGAQSVTSIDASDYEGASLVHDLNRPTPLHLDRRFDAIVDGGSLEHIFNVPIAISSLMRMTDVGGYVCVSVPANNLCGHGFYQFSPEFMFRVFSEQSGFVLRTVLLATARFPGIELTSARRAYRVVDPAEAGERVGLISRHPAMLIAVAQKVAHLDDPLAREPAQSDYVARWRSRHEHDVRGPVGARRQHLPLWLRLRLRGHRQRVRHSLANRRFYRPLE